MDRSQFYAAILEAGFEVSVFSDHPASFGSWYAVVARESLKYRLVFDGRDAVLSLQVKSDGGDWGDIQSKKSRYDSGKDILTQCKQWLIEASSA